MDVREVMSQPVVTVGLDTSLAEVVRIMMDHRIGCVPVTDETGRLRGIITETDFTAKERAVPFSIHLLPQVFHALMPPAAIERVRETARTATARQIMNSEVITTREDMCVQGVAEEMLRSDIDHLPVVRDGIPIGIVSRHDLLRMIVQPATPA